MLLSTFRLLHALIEQLRRAAVPVAVENTAALRDEC
jgi:hypothetical protein